MVTLIAQASATNWRILFGGFGAADLQLTGTKKKGQTLTPRKTITRAHVKGMRHGILAPPQTWQNLSSLATVTRRLPIHLLQQQQQPRRHQYPLASPHPMRQPMVTDPTGMIARTIGTTGAVRGVEAGAAVVEGEEVEVAAIAMAQGQYPCSSLLFPPPLLKSPVTSGIRQLSVPKRLTQSSEARTLPNQTDAPRTTAGASAGSTRP